MQSNNEAPEWRTADRAETEAPYPSHLENRLHLKDGRDVFVRPILAADGPCLRAAMAKADEDTIRNRFLGWRLEPDDELIGHLTQVDYRWRLALVALSPDSEGVAVARYEGKPGEDLAEAAVVVDPGWRRVGLGIQLLDLLRQAALWRGIPLFWAAYLGDNQAVAGLLRASGLPHTTTVSAGIIEVTIDLSPIP